MEIQKTEEKLSVSLSSSSSTSSSCSSSSFHNNAYCSSGLRFIDFLRDNEREWKLAEKRFDQLCWSSVASEPALKWSNFPFCIGMSESQEFAYQLLRALRRRKNWKIEITKSEFHILWCQLIHSSVNSRTTTLFHLCDRNMDGKVTEKDIKQMIMLSASTNKLSVTHEEGEDYAALVMEELDEEKQGYLELPQFEKLFKISSPKTVPTLNKQSSNKHIRHRHDPFQESICEAEMLLRSRWRRAWMVALWLIICLALFAWKFIQYRQRTAFQVMGYCLSIAKGAAETLKFNMALVLLPVCRNTITWLRRNSSLNSIIPFNDNLNFHKLVAGGIVAGVILHGGTHLVCDLPRISGCEKSIFEKTVGAQFNYHQPSYGEMLATTESLTGIIMVILMAIAFLLATKWPRRKSTSLPRSIQQVTGYNTFWYSHHLFIFVYALLIVHSIFLFLTDKATEKTTWMYIAIPVSLYTGERILRAIRSCLYEVNILKARTYSGKVLFLKLSKPERFKYQSGMYVLIQCPQISPFEWHPYSLTSAPQDTHLSVHIRNLGDWSYELYSLFQEGISPTSKEYPKIFIDGPYGAASQDHVKYNRVVLIGLGIGATPFMSILKDVLIRITGKSDGHTDNGKSSLSTSKTYLYWVTREQSSFDWFKDFMKDLTLSDQTQLAVEMHNFLTSVYHEGDVRSVPIRAIKTLHYTRRGIDIVSKTPTHFGRPNWTNIFSSLAHRHKGERIGVFYCGPLALARELEGLCTKFSTKTSTRFVFHKENY
ncbi:respiratory burst oxidase homolog protein A-like isoform X2 [Benincasa hispida]|uniref:respiratory burst oxidase homolog protein A-like isoform X2 n=1 Tax=Benincasa hispida TaxID=102211 RepID=UPI0019025CEE|nr:respiratory burst oxidase homolog protein A-like isoform X2 [Benincasa hispida]